MIWPIGHLAEAWQVSRADRLFPEPKPGAVHALDVPLVPVHDAFDMLARAALEVAIDEIGHGETEGNNRGEWIRQYCAPSSDGYEWCAAFVGFCYQRASDNEKVPLPFKRSLGAKRLGLNVAAVGRKFTSAVQARPGDLVVWDRGVAGSYQGHVGILERVHDVGMVQTIEGNSGANVRRRHHAIATERLAFFASIRP